MPTNPLAEIFRYNKWANLTLLEACRTLTDEHLDASPADGYSSIRETLVHIVGGQQTFVLRTVGRQHEGELNRDSPWPGFDSLVQLATTSSDDLIAIAESLNEDTEVDLPYLGKTYRFPKSFFLADAIAHSTEHRTEVLLTMAGLGLQPPNLDGWQYAAAAGHGAEIL
jgi:uncharacterized damage-inducible protein DinB